MTERQHPEDDMKRFRRIMDAARKLKTVMKRRGLRRAKAHCPICGTGFLHGVLAGPKQHLHMQCDTRDCAFLME